MFSTSQYRFKLIYDCILLKDILDSDRFWRDELLRANDDRLFGCSIYDLRHGSGQYPGDPGYGPPTKTVNG